MAAEVMTSALSSPGLDSDSAVHQRVEIPAPENTEGNDGGVTWKKGEGVQEHSGNQRKKGHRRKPSKKKKWKPYSKMSWQERKELDEKEKSKAVRMREEMKEKGRPVAPYNTTQFLMDEHDPHEHGFEPTGYANSNNDGESCSGDDDSRGADDQITAYTDSPHMVSEFISQDFSETYERVHEESLTTMSRDDLLTEHMDLERKFNQIQEQLSKTKRRLTEKAIGLEAKVQSLESEKEQMREEINRLRTENEILRQERGDSRMSTSDESEAVEVAADITQPPDCEILDRR